MRWGKQRGRCFAARVPRLAGVVLIAGCGGDARVELSAADALRVLAGQMELAVEEYHADVSRCDETREAAVIEAFADRLRSDASDDAAVASHVTAFKSALGRIREDQSVAWARRAAAMENVAALREVAGGLQTLALQSLTLNDELRRYLMTRLGGERVESGR